MLLLLAGIAHAVEPVARTAGPAGPAGPLVPLAYPPGTHAGNEARFYVLSLHLKFAPGPEDERPLEVATCPERLALVPIPAALAALKRGFALAGLEVKVDGEKAGLSAVGPPPAKGPFVLVLPQSPPAEVVAKLGATSGSEPSARPMAVLEGVEQGFVVVSTVDHRRELEGALCPDAGAAPRAP